MSEQVVSSVASAVTGELTSRVLSGLIQRYGKDAAISDKLQQLEMLLIKIHSTVEASEKRNIDNSWLLRWRDNLKEAASQGDEVLARFVQHARDALAQASSSVDANQKRGEAASSSGAASTTAVGVLSFTRNSLSDIAQGIRNARRLLLVCGDDDIERLNKILARLEKLSWDIGEFIRLLHLETLQKVDQTPSSTALSSKVHGTMTKMMKKRKKTRMQHHANPSLEPTLLTFSPPKEIKMKLGPPPSRTRRAFRRSIQDRLETAFTEICKVVELADGHDLEDLEWLAYWADILREAKEQGRDVLGTTRACKTVNAKDNKEPAVECDQEKDELRTLVHRLEGLARDIEYFSKLVYLCPAG